MAGLFLSAHPHPHPSKSEVCFVLMFFSFFFFPFEFQRKPTTTTEVSGREGEAMVGGRVSVGGVFLPFFTAMPLSLPLPLSLPPSFLPSFAWGWDLGLSRRLQSGFSILPGRLSPASLGAKTETSLLHIPVIPDIHPHRCSTEPIGLFSRWLLNGNLPRIWASLKPYLYYFHRRYLFGVTLLFVYSLGRLKYSILCTITAEHSRQHQTCAS